MQRIIQTVWCSDDDAAERVSPRLLFAGPAFRRVGEARALYTETFPASRVHLQPAECAVAYSEVDAWWDALASIPGPCGWMRDPVGLSWQIVPENYRSLLGTPGAFERASRMGTIVIEEV
ncbi:VOC family protein [Corynebacterium liangguodongii]|uniref:Uncharacterized protein n=1 Tax=Corynebacterium liangguodongii TaxID=2079535 RepID=A0A2S0WCR3_9CORY|nr:VOC family protein [Corynebacterium liangguodongii]AWB83553.1 hypothetical protein C3E79_02820 [Corynebacterium liangguodongii]PWC00357.1 hypothetical protein DF219_00135 [Corynebacterium liangguodongii]